MKRKINLISATIVIALSLGVTAYAHGPEEGFLSDYSLDERGYAMMDGHGMMGGYGYHKNGYEHHSWDQDGQNLRDYHQNEPIDREKAESLINEIEKRRKELSYLLLSDSVDKILIDRKIEEINRLEKYLDESIP